MSKMLDASALEAAERFTWLNARLIDRLRFAHLFRGGAAAPVVAALRPYQNADGGFGNALEPDFRGPVSQPATVEAALRVLDLQLARVGPGGRAGVARRRHHRDAAAPARLRAP